MPGKPGISKVDITRAFHRNLAYKREVALGTCSRNGRTRVEVSRTPSNAPRQTIRTQDQVRNEYIHVVKDENAKCDPESLRHDSDADMREQEGVF